MKKWMYDCVMEAPEACRTVLKNKDELLGKLVEYHCKKPYKKVILVASGSSYNIANCAKYAMQEFLGIHVECIPAVTFARYDYKYHEDAFVMFLSQSGKSTNTIEAVHTAMKYKMDAAVITMMEHSPMNKLCENAYIYGTAEYGEDVFVCRGVPSSSLYLMLFALEVGLKKNTVTKERYKTIIKDMELLIKSMNSIRNCVDAWYDGNKEDFYQMKRVMTVGIGPGYGIALEGALKIEETVGIPANAYEADEFLHGPVFEIKKDHGIFIVDLDEAFHDRAVQIYEAMKQLSDRVYLITRFSGIVDNRVLFIDECAESILQPLVFAIPFQVLSSRVCDDLRISAITVYNYRASQIVKTKADL